MARVAALRFGPYPTPEFEYDDIVFDERWGDVRIVGITDARIPWPLGKPLNRRSGRFSVVLYAGLVDAVRQESRQTLMYWWGVGASTAQAWRRWMHTKPLAASCTTAPTGGLRLRPPGLRYGLRSLASGDWLT